MERAIRLLAAKSRSTAELRSRLLEKEWANEKEVEEIIDKLRGYGYLNDRDLAHSVARAEIRRKPQGRRRLRQVIARREIERPLVDEAVEAALAELPESELINAAIEKRVRTRGVPQTREEAKKLFDHLLRRGFDLDLVRERVEALRRSAA
jgi:regulatory protein